MYDYFHIIDDEIPNLGKECYRPGRCDRKAGHCDRFCGTKAACCRDGYDDLPECFVGGCKKLHCCVRKVMNFTGESCFVVQEQRNPEYSKFCGKLYIGIYRDAHLL